jgi:hypothetical protein
MSKTVLTVKYYNDENYDYIGQTEHIVDSARAERILRNYEATLAGVIDPETDLFLDELQESLESKFEDYFKEHPCDVNIKITKA